MRSAFRYVSFCFTLAIRAAACNSLNVQRDLGSIQPDRAQCVMAMNPRRHARFSRLLSARGLVVCLTPVSLMFKSCKRPRGRLPTEDEHDGKLKEGRMAEVQAGPGGPDLTQGISLAELPDGAKLTGRVANEPVLLVRRGPDVFAIGAHCTHYSGPLADGLIVDDTVRCPWHHACFDLRTGEALRAPAFSPVDSWLVEQLDGKIFVREKRARPSAKRPVKSDAPNRIVIVGGGGAGFAAADMLRRQKYEGE